MFNNRIQSLNEACIILQQARMDVCREPMAIYEIVANAQRYLDKQLREELRSN